MLNIRIIRFEQVNDFQRRLKMKPVISVSFTLLLADVKYIAINRSYIPYSSEKGKSKA